MSPCHFLVPGFLFSLRFLLKSGREGKKQQQKFSIVTESTKKSSRKLTHTYSNDRKYSVVFFLEIYSSFDHWKWTKVIISTMVIVVFFHVDWDIDDHHWSMNWKIFHSKKFQKHYVCENSFRSMWVEIERKCQVCHFTVFQRPHQTHTQFIDQWKRFDSGFWIQDSEFWFFFSFPFPTHTKVYHQSW